LKAGPADEPSTWGTLFGWLFVHSLGKVLGESGFEEQSRTWIDEWLLGRIMAGALQDFGLDEQAAWQAVAAVKVLTGHQRWFDLPARTRTPAVPVLESLLKDGEVQRFLQVNRFRDVLWFDKAAFDRLMWWLLVVGTVSGAADPRRAATDVADQIAACYDLVQAMRRAEDQSGYQVAKLLEAAKG